MFGPVFDGSGEPVCRGDVPAEADVDARICRDGDPGAGPTIRALQYVDVFDPPVRCRVSSVHGDEGFGVEKAFTGLRPVADEAVGEHRRAAAQSCSEKDRHSLVTS